MNPIGIRRIVLRKSGMFTKYIMFSQNKLSCKNHVPGRGTAAVHCITLYESVANPGHSSRSLRNNISFAMQIVVRNGHLASSGPKPGHRVVCVAMGPHRGPMGPQGGAPGIHAPARAPRRPESIVSVHSGLPDDAFPRVIRVPNMLTDDAFPPPTCLLYTSPSPRDKRQSRMPSSA